MASHILADTEECCSTLAYLFDSISFIAAAVDFADVNANRLVYIATLCKERHQKQRIADEQV